MASTRDWQEGTLYRAYEGWVLYATKGCGELDDQSEVDTGNAIRSSGPIGAVEGYCYILRWREVRT